MKAEEKSPVTKKQLANKVARMCERLSTLVKQILSVLMDQIQKEIIARNKVILKNLIELTTTYRNVAELRHLGYDKVLSPRAVFSRKFRARVQKNKEIVKKKMEERERKHKERYKYRAEDPTFGFKSQPNIHSKEANTERNRKS